MMGYCIYWDAIRREDYERGFLLGPLRASTIGDIAVALALYHDGDRSAWKMPTLVRSTPTTCNERN